MLTLHLQRFVQATEIVVLFDNHFKDLPAAVEAWDFTSCKWLARGAEDSNRVSVSKDLSKMAPQFDVWEMSLKRVSETMDWLPQAEKSEVADSIAGLAELKKKVEYSTRLLATSILADKVLTIERSEATDEDDVLKAPIKYVTQVLKVNIEALPVPLRERLFNNPSKQPLSTMSTVSIAASSTDTASTVAKAAILPRKLKLKKLG